MRIGIYKERSNYINSAPVLIEQLELSNAPVDLFTLKRMVHAMLSERGWQVRSVNHLHDTSSFDIRAVVGRVEKAPTSRQPLRPTHRGGIQGGPLSDCRPPLNKAQGVPAMSALQRALTRARRSRP